jgi:transcription initiation factor IIE alpha subunit
MRDRETGYYVYFWRANIEYVNGEFHRRWAECGYGDY